MMTLQKKFFLFTFCLLCWGQIFAQTDSTDLNYYMISPILEDEEDSLSFPEEYFAQTYLEFDVDDTADFGGFKIEISYTTGNILLYKGEFDKADLLSSGIMVGNHITLDLGKLEKVPGYTFCFSLKNYSGLLAPTLVKHFTYVE